MSQISNAQAERLAKQKDVQVMRSCHLPEQQSNGAIGTKKRGEKTTKKTEKTAPFGKVMTRPSTIPGCLAHPAMQCMTLASKCVR